MKSHHQLTPILIFGILAFSVGISLPILSKSSPPQTTTSRATGGLLSGKGALHIVLSDQFRSLSPIERQTKRDQMMRLLREAGTLYGRDKLEWNKVTNMECYPGGNAANYTQDSYWTEYDQIFGLYKKYGIEPVVTLMSTPKHCSHAPLAVSDSGPSRTYYPPFGCLESEIDQTEGANAQYCWKWRSFVSAAVKRYGYGPGGKQYIKHWEIWNEPDLTNQNAGAAQAGATIPGSQPNDGYWWKGTVNDYERLLGVAYRQIKKEDPSSVVLLGGVTQFALMPGKPEFVWLNMLFKLMMNIRATHTAWFDIMNFHDYTPSTVTQYDQSISLLNAYSLNMPIWITEVSGISGDHGVRANWTLPTKMNNLYARGAGKIFWFLGRDFCADSYMNPQDAVGSQTGLLDCNLSPTSIYTSFKNLFL